MRSADAWRRIDAPVGEVVAVATDPGRLHEWFRPVDAVHPGGSADLGRAGSSVPVTWRLGRRSRAHLTAVRRIRDVLYTDLMIGGVPAGRLCFSFSPWDGGTAVELRADLHPSWLPRPNLRRALVHSIHALDRIVTGTGRPTRSPEVAGEPVGPLGPPRRAGVASGT